MSDSHTWVEHYGDVVCADCDSRPWATDRNDICEAYLPQDN